MIIGFCGAIGAGKSTAARYLERHYDYVRLGFAKPLKDMCRAFGLNDDQLYGNLKEVPDHKLCCGKTPRQLMQWLGHEWGRELVGTDVWVNAWRAQAIKHPNVVADDVRYPNEVAAIHELGGKVVWLGRASGASLSSHESETQTLAFDHEIDNNTFATTHELHARVSDFIWGLDQNTRLQRTVRS